LRITLWISVVLSLLLPLSVLALTESSDLPTVQTKVKTIAAFKNGLGFVYRSGKSDLSDGWVAMDQVPSALLGSFWIGTTSAANPVKEVIAFKGKVKDVDQAMSIADLLTANVGQHVKLEYSIVGNSEPRTVEGTIIAVPVDTTPGAVIESNLRYSSSYQPNPSAQIVLLGTSTGTLAINKSSVLTIETGPSATMKTKLDKEVPRAKIHVGGEPKSAEITLAYLEKGITWSPSYLINIKDEKMADITLEAVLGNDVEDLDDAEVSFVVGYPNFAYSNFSSLLSLQQSVAQFIQGLSQQGGTAGYAGSQIMSQSLAFGNNAAFYDRGEAWSPENTYSTGAPMGGESNEDLYFYKQDHVTLKKGDRARYTVFTVSVPYEHIYKWEIPDSMNIDDRGYNSGNSSKPEYEDQVWHSLKIENTSKLPWTTAPALAVNGSMPVAQDVLKYTPHGAKNTLKLTVATDVKGDQVQTEVSRKPTTLYNRNYDEIVVAGKLTIKNYKNKTINTDVVKSIVGDVQEVGQDGKVTKVAKKLTAVNSTSEVEWEFSLNAGEEKTLTYSYKVLIGR
jgi:hypothetical protein